MGLQITFTDKRRRRRSARGEQATFVVSNASGAAIPVSQPIDLKDLGPILSEDRLKEVRQARRAARLPPAAQA